MSRLSPQKHPISWLDKIKALATISQIGSVHAATVRKAVTVVVVANFQSILCLNAKGYVMEPLATVLLNTKY